MAVGLDLDQYQMKRRVLLLFAPDPRDARYEQQRAFLEDDEDQLEGLGVTVFGIFEDGPSFAEERPLSSDDSRGARDEFGVLEGDFSLRLIDLDGTEILRSGEPLPVLDLVDVVAGKEG